MRQPMYLKIDAANYETVRVALRDAKVGLSIVPNLAGEMVRTQVEKYFKEQESDIRNVYQNDFSMIPWEKFETSLKNELVYTIVTKNKEPFGNDTYMKNLLYGIYRSTFAVALKLSANDDNCPL